MKIEDFELAGRVAEKMGLSDEELDNLVKVQSRVVAYLRARGPHYYLASSHLRQELERFEEYKRNRVEDKRKGIS